MAKTRAKGARARLSGHHPLLHTAALGENLRRLGLARRGLGLDQLRSQLLLLLWRFPDAALEDVCRENYVDARAVGHALTRLRQHGYIRSVPAKSKGPLLGRDWRLTAKALRLIPELLRAEERLHQSLAAISSTFATHWCYHAKSLNSSLRQTIEKMEDGGEAAG